MVGASYTIQEKLIYDKVAYDGTPRLARMIECVVVGYFTLGEHLLYNALASYTM